MIPKSDGKPDPVILRAIWYDWVKEHPQDSTEFPMETFRKMFRHQALALRGTMFLHGSWPGNINDFRLFGERTYHG